MTASTAPSVADWAWAERIGIRVATASVPRTSLAEVAGLRSEIDRLAADADRWARQVTGLGNGLGPPQVRVVSRGQWIRDNLASLEWLTRPLAERLAQRATAPGTRTLGRKVAGTQIGTVFGLLASRVLGQYEVFLPGGVTPGRLTLVGPNLLHVERTVLPEFGVSPRELRFGVVLHELAHRLQFEAVDWIRPELTAILDAYLADTRLGPDRIRETLDGLVDLLRTPGRVTDLRALLEVVLTPEQRSLLEHAQRLMSLLEGHGNVVMDWGAEAAAKAGGEQLDASRVRRALNARRERSGILRSALGMALKAEQYRVGERFILTVADRHGRRVFDRVWEDRGNLPSTAELEDPDAWAARVTGESGSAPPGEG